MEMVLCCSHEASLRNPEAPPHSLFLLSNGGQPGGETEHHGVSNHFPGPSKGGPSSLAIKFQAMNSEMSV